MCHATLVHPNATYNPIHPTPALTQGYEPGNQAAGGVWEGEEEDKTSIQFISANGYGGAMIW